MAPVAAAPDEACCASALQARPQRLVAVRQDGGQLFRLGRSPAGGGGHLRVDLTSRLVDLRYLLLGEDADPKPPPGESPDARWCGWDEAFALIEGDPGLSDGLRRAQGAYEGLA